MLTRLRFDDPSIQPLLSAANLGSYELLLARRKGRRGAHVATYHVSFSEDGRRAYVKVYRPGSRCWHFLLRPSKAWWEAFNLRRLARWGVPVVRVLATGARRSWRGLEDALLMTEEWPDSQPLADYALANWPVRNERLLPHHDRLQLRRQPVLPPHRQEQRQIGRALARTVAAMHARHFYHIDLKWRNILVRRRTGGGWQLALLDCPRGFRAWTLPGQLHGQTRDLATLDLMAAAYLTRTDRLRWLLDYLGLERLTPAGRRLARRVGRYYQAAVHRRRQRGVIPAVGVLAFFQICSALAGG